MLPFPLSLNHSFSRLYPLIEPLRPPESRLPAALRAVGALRYYPDQALELLRRHGLGPLFLAAVEEHGLVADLPARVRLSLEHERRAWLAGHLFKEKALDIASVALSKASVPYALIKGHHLCRVLYGKPQERPHADVDLVVGPARKMDAVQALRDAGFRPHVKPENLSHELIMRGHHVEVDLHWELFRPGRARIPLAWRLVEDADRTGGVPVSSPLWTLVLMLTHPTFTEHVTSRLVRAIDLVRWVSTQPCPWDEVLKLLEEARLRTSAWAMLAWTSAWFGDVVPAEFERAIRPSRARQAYLKAWLAADPARRYDKHPTLVRGAFSMGLQEGVGDVVRAVGRRNVNAPFTSTGNCYGRPDGHG